VGARVPLRPKGSVLPPAKMGGGVQFPAMGVRGAAEAIGKAGEWAAAVGGEGAAAPAGANETAATLTGLGVRGPSGAVSTAVAGAAAPSGAAYVSPSASEGGGGLTAAAALSSRASLSGSRSSTSARCDVTGLAAGLVARRNGGVVG